jgi:hypothetical protein
MPFTFYLSLAKRNKMKRFVFLIPQTPIEFRSPLRDKLWKVTLHSLMSQKGNDWQAIIVGEQEMVDGPFIYIQSPAKKKGVKLEAALRYIQAQEIKPEYLIRFDDDDIINEELLFSLKDQEFDCYADRWQAHIDMLTGKVILKDFPWMANSIIQGYEHAISRTKEGYYLIASDHTKFHEYYTGKKVIYAPKNNPSYMRVLSPTCVSVSARLGEVPMGQYDMEKYYAYRNSYRNLLKLVLWQKRDWPFFKKSIKELQSVTREFFPAMLTN